MASIRGFVCNFVCTQNYKYLSYVCAYIHTDRHVCKIVIFVNTFIFVLVCFLPFVAVVDVIVVVAAVVVE